MPGLVLCLRALSEATLRGIALGDVREDRAREHHPKWVEDERGL
jgi:hypothetical protein